MKHILANMMMAIVLIACSNGGMDPVDNGGEDEYVPVRVETVEDNGVETRAVALSNASIGIFRTAPYTATYPHQYDVQCTHDGTGRSLADKLYVGGTDASLHVYYPYCKVTFNGDNSTVTALTVKDNTADNDFCYADAPLAAVNNRNPVASFLLKHAYAGVKFSIACHSTYPLKCKLTKIVMKPATSGKRFYVERSMDISKSAADAGQFGGSTASGWTRGGGGGGAGRGVTIDGSEYSVTIPYETLKALKAGYLSTIFLEVKGTGVDISGVKVYPWDTSVVPGGDNDATLD